LVRIEELLSFKVALLDYLMEIVARFTSIDAPACLQTTKINRYLQIALQDMKETPQMSALFDARPAIRQYWCVPTSTFRTASLWSC
jgi:hypothetical protein